jgi:hypothetical protein
MNAPLESLSTFSAEGAKAPRQRKRVPLKPEKIISKKNKKEGYPPLTE